MKKISLLIVLFSPLLAVAQDTKTDIASARTAYQAKKLQDAHFALQQALSDIDMNIGQEVLKKLPPKMDTAAINPKDDHVMANTGFAGATVHRSYGKMPFVEVELISNSPLLGSLNSLLSLPLIGGLGRDENNKTVKVQGYKARLERHPADNDLNNYTLQIPFSNALLTFTVNHCTERDVLKLAETLPLDDIAALIK
jgi:hypothetical protein